MELIEMHYFEFHFVCKNFEVVLVGTNSKCQNLRVMLHMHLALDHSSGSVCKITLYALIQAFCSLLL